MNTGVTCSTAKPGKESARNCAINLLTKVMRRPILAGNELTGEVSFTPREIEDVIYKTYPSRDTYLDKIAKVALHLSLFTRTGRVSYTFQNAIYNRSNDPDYLESLLTTEIVQDFFPELYKSYGYISEDERSQFEAYMHTEHAVILEALHVIVRKCCDTKVCTPNEFDLTYDQELFKEGSIFQTTARSVCMTRKFESWIPPSQEISIPDTSPLPDTRSLPESSIQADEMDRTKFIEDVRSKYISAQAPAKINRNFDVSGQIVCFNVDNLIHNLATLPEGRLLELPFDSALLPSNVEEELKVKFKVEIGMRKYYLDSISK